MKCEIQFSGKKKYINFSSAEYAHRVVEAYTDDDMDLPTTDKTNNKHAVKQSIKLLIRLHSG